MQRRLPTRNLAFTRLSSAPTRVCPRLTWWAHRQRVAEGSSCRGWFLWPTHLCYLGIVEAVVEW